MKTIKKINFTDWLVYISIGIFIFGSGYKLGEWNIRKNARGAANYSIFNANDSRQLKDAKNVDFSLFWDVWEKVQDKYVDENKVDPQKMFYGAVKGMVASVGDPYTFFLTPDENKATKDDLGGRFEGIGAQLGLKDNQVVVMAPLKGSPAEKAGIRTGDIIIGVDGQSTKGWTLPQTVSKIRGEKGTKVSLKLMRGDKELNFNLTREQINVPSVELTTETNNGKNVAHLKLNQFGDNTNTEWDKAVDTISGQWKNGQISGMVLDLRGNPGGYLESAVYLASEFIEPGKVVVKQESSDGNDRVYKVERDGRLVGIPLTVLIDQGSASASEILSGAIRDNKKGTLVGTKSFGKGSVQEAMDLNGGAGLHVTIAKWILPNGDWIMGKGIEPDVKVENKIPAGETITNETDAQLKKAVSILTQ